MADSNALTRAVRTVLRASAPALGATAGIVATALAATVVPVVNGLFPPEIELSTLLPANGGDASAGFVLNGIQGADAAGVVGTAGDVNGDGIGDLIIGAPRAAPDGRSDAGQIYVVFGRDTSQGGNFPALTELSSLLPANGGDGLSGFVMNGINAGDLAGHWVTTAGDVNGDGVADLIIGAMLADPHGDISAGQSYVVFGRDVAQAGAFPAVIELASLLSENGGSGTVGFVLNGTDHNDYSGNAVSAAGDVNGDGIDDLVVGAYFASFGSGLHAGESFVVFGRDAARDGGFPAELELAGLLPDNGGDGSAGFVLTGRGLELSGCSVSAAGDVNGDGVGDLIIGALYAAPDEHRPGAGRGYVVFGRNVAQAGRFPAVMELSSLLPASGGDGSLGFVMNGVQGSDETGSSVSGAGDINGDGIADMLIGAPKGTRTEDGAIFLLFGRDVAQTGRFPPVIELETLLPVTGGDGSAGFVLRGVDSYYGWAGAAVSAAGDVNGDGMDDLIVGAVLAPPHGGASYVVFGRDVERTGSFPPVISLSTLLAANGGDGGAGFALNGIQTYDRLGGSVSAAADVNGDGIDDVIVGAAYADAYDVPDVGQSYVIFGVGIDSDDDGVIDKRDNCIQVSNADQRDTNADGFGNACDADLDNDCVIDFSDLALLKAVFFTSDADADFDGNGRVSFSDVGIMKVTFFQAPGPSGIANACT